ncbi:MAG: acyl-CoA dehydrogenase family protein [Quadrisphaera sp.]
MTAAPPRPPRPSRPELAPHLLEADALGFADLLATEDAAVLARARERFRSAVQPVVAGCWEQERFPHEVVPALGELGLVEVALDPSKALLHGLAHVELASVDLSMSTFLGVHSLLFANAVHLLGSPAQRAELLPSALDLSTVGAFALTEPEHGSDISRGLATTATREGDCWRINGVKRWIGNGTHADVLLVWARDTADHQIKGFLVPRDAPGVTTSRIEHKTGLRIVQNADVALVDVLVDDDRRLAGAASFGDLNTLLTTSRAWVAWQAVGVQVAAYRQAVACARSREQFGRPVASFQLVQDKLVRILDATTASLAVAVRLAQLQAAGRLRPEHAALAKAGNSTRMREAVALGRGVLGGNGILADHGMARTFADAEALYSYEGTHEVNTLVVGRAITGISAIA